ncbi:MAG: DUF4328 domain-containing protein [Acidimicrobiia bacterium]
MDPNPVAEWYQDPVGRGDFRYWDGTAWSQWVATGGVSRVDDQPLAPDLPPPPPPIGAPGFASRTSAPYGGVQPRYSSLRGLWIALALLIGIEILTVLTFAGTVVNRLVQLDHFDQTPSLVTATNLRDADDAVGAAAGWLSLIALAILVLVIIYLFRASKNTALWRSDRPTWAAGWTIGAWFIPLANAVLPCLVICEIWKRSDPGAADPAARRGSARVVWWWVVFVVGFVAASIDISSETINEARAQDWVNLSGAVILIVAAVLFVGVVRALTRRQELLAGAGNR